MIARDLELRSLNRSLSQQKYLTESPRCVFSGSIPTRSGFVVLFRTLSVMLCVIPLQRSSGGGVLRSAQQSGHIRIGVWDTGPGIAEEQRIAIPRV